MQQNVTKKCDCVNLAEIDIEKVTSEESDFATKCDHTTALH